MGPPPILTTRMEFSPVTFPLPLVINSPTKEARFFLLLSSPFLFSTPQSHTLPPKYNNHAREQLNQHRHCWQPHKVHHRLLRRIAVSLISFHKKYINGISFLHIPRITCDLLSMSAYKAMAIWTLTNTFILPLPPYLFSQTVVAIPNILKWPKVLFPPQHLHLLSCFDWTDRATLFGGKHTI